MSPRAFFSYPEQAAIKRAAELYADGWAHASKLPSASGVQDTVDHELTADAFLDTAGFRVGYRRGDVRYGHIITEVVRLGREIVASRRRNGLRKLTPHLTERARYLYEVEGQSVDTVAALVGVHRASVYRAFKRMGVAIRRRPGRTG